MRTHPELYPPHERATNVVLIRGLISAHGEEAIEDAIADVAESLHPSLFSELDWMELTMPAPQRAAGGDMADFVFTELLPQTVAQRRVELVLARRPRPDPLVSLSLGQPVLQARLRDPKVRGDVLDPHARLAVARDPDHVLAELAG